MKDIFARLVFALVYYLTDRKIALDQNRGQVRLALRLNKPEAKGTLILVEDSYGFWLECPAVHPEPLALLDLFYASPEAQSEGLQGPPFQIVLHSPAQTEDPLGRARFYPAGTLVDFEQGVTYRESTYRYPIDDPMEINS